MLSSFLLLKLFLPHFSADPPYIYLSMTILFSIASGILQCMENLIFACCRLNKDCKCIGNICQFVWDLGLSRGVIFIRIRPVKPISVIYHSSKYYVKQRVLTCLLFFIRFTAFGKIRLPSFGRHWIMFCLKICFFGHFELLLSQFIKRFINAGTLSSQFIHRNYM